ncbi:hypothetical protein MRX96_003022 [Rhipicephalus microplus]
MMFRTNKTTGSITREQLESGGKKFLEEVLDRDLAFLRGVPNTVQYWQDRRSELFAMIRQLGKPHAFLTMSTSEVHWERLLETLEQLRVGPDGTPRPVSEMVAWERVELVNEDPVACTMFINRIFDVIMNVLADRNCSPFRPYVIRDYFKRVEFQQRGSAHVHVILWLEEAPDEQLTEEIMGESQVSEVSSVAESGVGSVNDNEADRRRKFIAICCLLIPTHPAAAVLERRLQQRF